MKKLFCKKLISAFLATVMLLAMIPAGMITVTAQTRSPATAPDDAIKISSAAEWNELAGTITSGNVVLTADIDFTGITPKTLFATFSGTFYGNGKTISNATIEAQALIATDLQGGTIQDVIIKNCSVTSSTDNNTGIIAATATTTAGSVIQYCTVEDCTGTFKVQSGAILGAASKSVTVNNCTVTGTTTIAGDGATAAIVGKVNNGCYTLKIMDCYVGENVTVSSSSCTSSTACGLGLVIGSAGGTSNTVQTKVTVSGCQAYGKVVYNSSAAIPYVGALIGFAYGATNDNAVWTVSGNTVGGSISVVNGTNSHNAVAGGIFGYFKPSVNGSKISNNTVSTNISSHYYVGGIIGEFAGTAAITVDIEKCKYTGTISVLNNAGGNTNMGGIIAFFATDNAASTVNINNCEVSATIANQCQYAGGRGTGGIIGRLGSNNTMNVTVKISDCLVSGAISRKNGNNYMANTAGVVGRVQATGATVTVEDVIVTATINGGSATNLGTNGAVIVGTKDNGTVNVTDCATTIANNDILVIPNDATVMNYIVSKEGNYISDVDIRDLLPKTYMQTSSVDEDTDTYIIRFVIESIVKDYDKVTTKIVVKNGEGGETVKTFTFDECTYFESLTGHKADITETYVAGEGAYKDCECFIAVAIMDVPNDGTDYYFEVTPTFTLGGITVEGTTFGGSYATGRPGTN